MINRFFNATNPHQGTRKKVLCVCSAGLLRSPTAAWVLSNEPFNFNTRAAGLDEGHALIAVDKVLLHWADEVVVMDNSQAGRVEEMGFDPNYIINLRINDEFEYRDPALVEAIKANYQNYGKASQRGDGS